MARRATTTFHAPTATVHAGEVRADDDALVVAYPQFFEDPNTLTERVETAVARPGTKRGKAPQTDTVKPPTKAEKAKAAKEAKAADAAAAEAAAAEAAADAAKSEAAAAESAAAAAADV